MTSTAREITNSGDQHPPRRRKRVGWKIILFVIAFLLAPILLSSSLRDTWCDWWGLERSWIKDHSPLRSPAKELWEDWRTEDIANHPAAREIAAIILKEIPEGAGLEVIAEHIEKHYKDARLEHEGMFKNSYFENAHGTGAGISLGEGKSILRIAYIYNDPYKPEEPGFRYATISLDRGKGHFHYFHIDHENQEPQWTDGRDQKAPTKDDKPNPHQE